MPKPTCSPQRMMLTTITELIHEVMDCRNAYFSSDGRSNCPVWDKLTEAKKALQTEVKNLGENDREVKA